MDLEYIGRSLPEGRNRTVVATARVNQSYFRHALLENYDRRHCLTGLGIEPLLVASHIKPWRDADPAIERLSPENGLLLNALHDRAFDQGLITIDRELRVVVSRTVPRGSCPGGTSTEDECLWRFHGRRIACFCIEHQPFRSNFLRTNPASQGPPARVISTESILGASLCKQSRKLPKGAR